MSKKSINKKEARKMIVDERANGKTDQEIYNELSQLYYDKKALTLLITGTVTAENKGKYKFYNNILLGLLGLVILSRVFLVFSLTAQTGQLWALLLVFIVPLLTFYVAYEISQYNAPIYRFCGLMSLVGLMQMMAKSESGAELLLNVVFTCLIASLSFYLDHKMFPHYSPGNLKKDSNGEYILS